MATRLTRPLAWTLSALELEASFMRACGVTEPLAITVTDRVARRLATDPDFDKALGDRALDRATVGGVRFRVVDSLPPRA